MFASDEDFKRADWPLLKDGAVTLFWRPPLYEKAKEGLAALGYQMIESPCQDATAFCRALGEGLKWKEQFGYEPWTGGLDALDEGLAGVPFDASGCIALCFSGFQRLAGEDEGFARGLLDVIALQSRHHLLAGRRMLALVQTDDATFNTGRLGGIAAMWNLQEWFDSARGLGEMRH